ncbi:MAG: hypothetical protein F4X20_07545 [Dehalococcoidia bacterium]|nr:hypothetical protein [Dehalococcoidia bacterium]
MISKIWMIRPFLIGAVVALILSVGILAACTSDNGSGEGSESGSERAGQEGSGRESGGEHGSGGESGSESGSEEGSGANQLAPDETFDTVRSGARLILSYDAGSNAFTGTVENTTNNVLTRVRIEVHLDNGTEIGPTTPIDLAPGEVVPVNLASTAASFNGWTPHAEVGSGEGGRESGTEGGNEGPEGTESGGMGAEAGEAEMSSPIIPLDETWVGNLGGLDVVARFDPPTQSVQSLVTNILPQVLCYVQAEPHLKSGTTTIGELGPDVLGHLSPGQAAATSVPLSSEPSLAGVSFDGYVVHLEVFDCGGTGPVPHAPGQGSEGGGSEGTGGEGHGPGGEGGNEGSQSGTSMPSGGEEGSGANQLAPNETFDEIRSGARLIMSYDAPRNTFAGTVENTTRDILTRVRVEVHLSNGTELGPTTPINLAPGQIRTIMLDSTRTPFTGWVAHAEVGSGEHGSGSESSGEHGSGSERGRG